LDFELEFKGVYSFENNVSTDEKRSVAEHHDIAMSHRPIVDHDINGSQYISKYIFIHKRQTRLQLFT